MRPLLHCGVWFARRLYPLAPLLFPFLLAAQTDNFKDPIFSTVPFDQWVAQGDHVDIPWRVKLSTPQLDDHQRFLVTVTITVDGKHLSRSLPNGELLMLMQIEDSQGRVYQGHAVEQLGDMGKDLRRADIVYTHSALVIPGDYRFTLAMLHRGGADQSQGDYDLGHATLHVAPLKNDPLPNAWEGTTPVEIIGKESDMEEWFHPDLTANLHLPLATRRPVRIELLVTLPRSRSAGEYYRQCMSALVAQMKVLSGIELSNGSIRITLLDAQHRGVVALSRHDRSLDWKELKPALEKSNPNVIDVRHLGTHGEEAEFLAAEVRRRLQPDSGQDSTNDERSAEPLPVLIFLSVPAGIGTEAGKPVALGELHDASAYLVRYHPVVAIREMVDAANETSTAGSGINSMSGNDVGLRQGLGRQTVPMPNAPRGGSDEKTITLQEVLRPLKPRIFDVDNPAQFREALAAILEEISRL